MRSPASRPPELSSASRQRGGARFHLVSVAMVVLALLIAGCAAKSDRGGPIPSPSPSPRGAASDAPSAAASPTPISDVATCAAGQLQPWAGPKGAAAGSVMSEFAFTNIGTVPCRLRGYPTVQMLTSTGADLQTTDQPAGHGFDSVAVAQVVLAPGARAYFGLYYPDSTGYGLATCPTASALRLTPPGAAVAAALTLTGAGAAIAPYGGSTIQQLHCGEITVTPVTSARLLPATVGSG